MNIKSSFDSSIRILVIGDSGVGKTNFIHRFVNGHFINVSATISCDSAWKICDLPKSKKRIKILIWDTPGQDKYRSSGKLFFHKVQGIILIYDITYRESFEKLYVWVRQINDNTSSIPVMLVGNKIDDEENRIVTKEEGDDFAKENDFSFMEASAKNGKNVNNVFFELSENIIASFCSSFDFDTSIIKNVSLNHEEENVENKKCTCICPC